MKIIRSVTEMHACADVLRSRGETIVLVPTMGYLHDGHLSLIRIGLQKGSAVIVSIFINPTQFGPGEDFKDYPRNWDRDVRLVASEGAACIFAPDAGEMYPDGYQTVVRVPRLAQHLCGISRPMHFEGVATVVAKLFNCTKPHCAVFGLKDYQQLQVIRQMASDLNFDIDIVGAPIVRESDGLAMSSRNEYLDADQRRAALCLSRALALVESMVAAGERNAEVLVRAAKGVIAAEAQAEIDYVTLCDAATLEETAVVDRDAVMALAVRFGRARLIDNAVLKLRNIEPATL